jgi:hypothetical protein
MATSRGNEWLIREVAIVENGAFIPRHPELVEGSVEMVLSYIAMTNY